jgi:hypothetical protein
LAKLKKSDTLSVITIQRRVGVETDLSAFGGKGINTMIAQGPPGWNQLEQPVVAEMRGVWEAAAQVESAGKVEQLVLEWRKRVGGMVLQTLCQQAVNRGRSAPLCCGEKLDHHRGQTKTVLTLLGAITVRRRYYRYGRCRWMRGWAGRALSAIISRRR